MIRGDQGEWRVVRVPDESFRAFIPRPLPPEPPLALDEELSDRLEKANRALGRLDALALLLPDISQFLYLYVRKEAVLSSQIEGTQSSLADLLLFESDEAPGVPLEDVQEVSRYVAALEHGMARLRGGFPLTTRLLREIHGILLSEGRGSEQRPGEIRRSQNWIGGSRPGNARFVPPPADEVGACLGSLERFIHDVQSRTPTLIKAALAHAQFETIHPFLDGNGRIGRMLITLLLCYEEALREPLLYLSYYLRQNRSTYYDLLQKVRVEGDWEAWLGFMCDGVAETADQAAESARRVLMCFERDRQRIEGLGRRVGSALRLHQELQRRPLLTQTGAAARLGLSLPTIIRSMEALEALGIVREISGRQRGRTYIYADYLALLDEGTAAPTSKGAVSKAKRVDA